MLMGWSCQLGQVAGAVIEAGYTLSYMPSSRSLRHSRGAASGAAFSQKQQRLLRECRTDQSASVQGVRFSPISWISEHVPNRLGCTESR